MWTSGETEAGSSSVPARTNQIGRLAVLAVHRHLAGRAAPDRLLRAVVARDGDLVRLLSEELHAAGLDQRVDDERASGLPLAIQAVTAVHDQRVGGQAVANGSARAPTLGCDAHVWKWTRITTRHGWEPPPRPMPFRSACATRAGDPPSSPRWPAGRRSRHRVWPQARISARLIVTKIARIARAPRTPWSRVARVARTSSADVRE